MAESSELFETAVFVVQNLPKDGPVKTSNDEKLKFYGLYKQATIGKCNVPKPSFFNIEASYKWSAWNDLGDMDVKTAEQEYVTAIVEKIKKVQETFKTEEWMNSEIFDILEPKMRALGIKTNNEGADESEKPEIIEKPVILEKPETTTNSSLCPLSDAEYADAIDDENQSRTSSFTEPRTSRHRRQYSPSLRSSCIRLEHELKSITGQIEKMGKAVEERHNLLLNLMKKATVYVLVPRAISLHAIVFFIFWPFVAHFLIRWIKRLMIFL